LSDRACSATYNTDNDHEPNDDSDSLVEICHILSRCIATFPFQFLDKVNRDIEIENGRTSNRTEEAHESSLPYALDLRDLLMEDPNIRRPSQKQDQYAEWYKTRYWDDVVRYEIPPRANCSIPHEDYHIKEHVYSGLE
jgi:hypothetical protein